VARLLCLFLALSVSAGATTVLVLPFENKSGAQHDWIGESIAEALGEQFRHPDVYLVSRADRAAAFEQLGLPPSLALSRATIIRLAELTSGQCLEMRRHHLSSSYRQSGSLAGLLTLQARLGDELRREAGLPAAAPSARTGLRPEAWESYVRGLIAPDEGQRIRLLREANRLEPLASGPAFALGKLYFQRRDYASAVPWLLRLKKDDSNFLEASFLLGQGYLHLGDFERAEYAFRAVTETLPLNEAFNNLGVAQSLRRDPAAVESFQRAMDGDPLDADYSFNLGCYYYRAGDYVQAVRVLREAVAKSSSDSQARALLAASQDRLHQRLQTRRARATSENDDPLARLDRIKPNYEEPSYRQLRMALERLKEEKLRKLESPERAAEHLARGRAAFEQGRDSDALDELQEALRLDPQNPDAYLYLARVLYRRGRTEEAKSAAANAVSFGKKDPEACLLLARIYLEQGLRTAALQAVRQALERDPDNATAQALLRDLEGGPRL
jgi:tetratricopeptide (TPR) repeat protein